jgi:hypothetical protein
VVPGDEDFDVEEWERRLHESPSGPVGPSHVRTRRPRPGAGPDPRHPSVLDPGTDPVVGDGGPDVDDHGDPFGGPGAAEAVTEEGSPAFAHDQWTVEGEIERFGAFGRGVSRSPGCKRSVAIALLALLVLPLALQAAQILGRAFS